MDDIYVVEVACKEIESVRIAICNGNGELSNFLSNIDREKFELLDVDYLGVLELVDYKTFLKTEENLVLGKEKENE